MAVMHTTPPKEEGMTVAPEVEVRAAQKVGAEVASIEARLAALAVKIPSLEAEYTALVRQEDELWQAGGLGADDAVATGEAYNTWAAAANATAVVNGQLLQAYAAQRTARTQLAEVASAGHREVVLADLLAADAKRQQRLANLRSGQAVRTLRAPVAEPAGTEELQAAMATHRPGYDEYVRARTAGDSAAQEAHRPAYTAYKQAYRQLLAARKAGATAPATQAGAVA
jgi:hypothetical protein